MLIKKQSEIDKIRQSGQILAETIGQLKSMVQPGVSLAELNQRAEELIDQAGAQPSFKNYRGFPAALCVSVNEVIVHGPPSDYKLKSGDIVSLDLGVFYQGFHSDMAVTVPVGSIDQTSQRLIYVTEEALMRGIAAVKPGGYLGDLGQAISSYVWKQGFDVVRELCGHGIGHSLHEEPDVLNFGQPGQGLMLRPGMVICLEPMVTVGRGRIKLGSDGLSYLTVDGSRSAHFEHTVAVTEEGSEILTQLP
ncbi:MAG TPA: type I methionyl aminopeptidase [Candidatus Pacearchaeota archaeon]|nr:type I methionyl aminopeptidase [Candidatus Pacearchaeota archaeon]